MSNIQTKLSDEALQALQAAGSSGRKLLEQFIVEEIDEYERWLMANAPAGLNDKLVSVERANLQTYIQWKMFLQMKGGSLASVSDENKA